MGPTYIAVVWKYLLNIYEIEIFHCEDFFVFL